MITGATVQRTSKAEPGQGGRRCRCRASSASRGLLRRLYSVIAAQLFQSPSGSRLNSRDRVVLQPRHGIDVAVGESFRDHLQRHFTGPPMLVLEGVDHRCRRGLVPGVQHRPKRPGPYEVILGAEPELDPPKARPTCEERHELRLIAPVHLAIKTHAAVHQPARPPALYGQPDQHGRVGVEQRVGVVCHDPIMAWRPR
jgi:hypothetical protein